VVFQFVVCQYIKVLQGKKNPYFGFLVVKTGFFLYSFAVLIIKTYVI